ncbi:unnamed protein product [Linum trigynum]|uniref:Uncharacterized protein n=1 Tax=Linum trigynum TaxID=586398 RepID=A0AAV2EPS3_9ROSI
MVESFFIFSDSKAELFPDTKISICAWRSFRLMDGTWSSRSPLSPAVTKALGRLPHRPVLLRWKEAKNPKPTNPLLDEEGDMR